MTEEELIDTYANHMSNKIHSYKQLTIILKDFLDGYDKSLLNLIKKYEIKKEKPLICQCKTCKEINKSDLEDHCDEFINDLLKNTKELNND